MLLISGGAYSGKRRIVRSALGQTDRLLLWSAYDGKRLEEATKEWKQAKEQVLVLEGWERWVEAELAGRRSSVEVRAGFRQSLEEWARLEQEVRSSDTEHRVILIMLEIGRGIVPIERERRELRDACGWLLQDAAELSNEVWYAWHGLHRVMKPLSGT